MATINLPEKLDFDGGELVEVSYLQKVFRISKRAALGYLRSMGIWPIYIGDRAFFNLMTFKRVLFVLTRPGAPGFLMPGSKGKANPNLLRDKKSLTEITPELLAQAKDPAILVEMAACSGRNPGVLSALNKNPVGRPSKRKRDDSVQK